MRRHGLPAIALALVAVVAVASPAALAADGTFTIESTQDHDTGDVTLTVTHDGDAVENASVIVDSEDPYAGNGTYETDANGTVDLPEPDETVTVEVTAVEGNTSTTTTVELVPRSESLDVAVDRNDDGSATVTVTQYGDAVENATVNVTSGTAYAGNGTYETDANGTVDLPVPEEDVAANVTATYDDLSAETTIVLYATDDLSVAVEQFDDGGAEVTVTRGGAVENATVDVSANRSYDGTGTYTTDANGTVDLPAPNETVEVTLNVTHEGDEVMTTATLVPTEEGNENGSFGQQVSAFVHSLLDDGERGIGSQVADFVVGNNPGNPPENAGPPEHAGPPDDSTENETVDETTEDETVENETADGASENETAEDDTRGPPEHAGPPDETAENETADGASENETAEDDTRGPPEHAGGNETAEDEDGQGPPDRAGSDEKDSQSDSSGGGGPPSHAKGR